ncbi:quinolinate synthase NadA [Candidatus Bipolaricaulota sp. J31]
MERLVVADVVSEARRALGEKLLILAHHYQRDEIVDVADYRGDSLELSRRAAASDARWIVFCGVHFMAETAAVLAKDGQRVLIPREDAGCFLAHTIDYPSLVEFWRALSGIMDPDREVLPVAYVNTTADVKAFVGEKGGACCTSSSAEAVLRWAFSRRPRVLFVPDQYLGRNTARRLGIPDEEIAVWDPRFPDLDRKRFTRARLILWRGTCNVHVRFLPEDVERVRRERPGVRVVVHPECRPEVVELADEVGSTSYIIRTVSSSPPGSVWAVGTEERLVARLNEENPDKEVFSLAEVPPFCSYMSLTRPGDLAAILEGLLRGEERNMVEVPPEIRGPARLSLERMLEITSK